MSAAWRERDGVVRERFSLGSSRRLTLQGHAPVLPRKSGAIGRAFEMSADGQNKNAGGPRTTRAFRWKEIF
ncbi:MAG: hypothetical protein EBY32_05410 [Proteobacteria bacterium]|nr:hypothetical protein [Pseudomonadota bacterium]